MSERQFESLEDIKTYAQESGFPKLAQSIEIMEDSVEEREDGWDMNRPDDLPLPKGQQYPFEFGVIVGTYLEREYPSSGKNNDEK